MLRIIAAVLVTVFSVMWVGLSLNYLDLVPVTYDGLLEGAAPSSGWLWSNAMLALALALWVTPVPNSRFAAVAPAVIGGVIVLIGLAFLGELNASIELWSPDRHCARTDCWPQYVQELLALVPAGMAAIALIVQGVLPLRWPWWRRAALPVGLLVVATITQVALWPDVVVPFLQADPAS